nr:hypothetical protein [uncultured Steroidobacter sp.]
MNSKVVGIFLSALLLAACAREQTNSDGNGTGNADGVGGRQDPATAPPMEGQPAPAPSDSEPSSAQPPQQ